LTVSTPVLIDWAVLAVAGCALAVCAAVCAGFAVCAACAASVLAVV